jgi:hypothetical protein
MFKKSRTLRIALIGILFLVIAAAVATFVYFKPIPTAQAAPSYLEPEYPNGGRNCIITEILVATDRIHVKCTTAQPAGVVWYAIHSDAAHARDANRYLVLLNTAWALNQDIYLWYNDSSAANPPGCAAASCRMLTGVFLIP